MSRLDRLFALLSSSSSSSTRHLAAKQLGEVQRLHPHELHFLLSRLHPLLRSKSWDTRIAASKALAAILNEVPIPVEVKEENGEEYHDENEAILKHLTWDKIQEHGRENQEETEVQDDDTSASSGDQLKQINSQLGLDMASKMGLINAEDIITNDDLKLEKSESVKSVSQLSTRERNSLRRKQKAEKKQHREEPSAKKAKFSHSPLYTFNENDEEVFKGEFQLGKFCSCLGMDLFNSTWEIRHGAATALREIIKFQGPCLGKRVGANLAENLFHHQNWLANFSIKFLWVISTDRFGDFVGDEMIAPVRESTSMALGALMGLMPAEMVERVVQLLLELLKHEEWEARHGGVLGLKHFLASSQAENKKLIIDSIYPSICERLSDDMDDVVSAAAGALLPIVGNLLHDDVNIKPGLESLAKKLSDILLEVDDLSGSTQSVMRLLDNILTVLSKTNRQLVSSDVIQLVHRLLPFLHNSSSMVRSSTLKTLAAAITTSETNPDFMASISPILLPHLYQRALLEHKPESLELVETIWRKVCQACPLQPLLLAACPVYGSWFALIQKPPNHPLPAELLLPVASTTSNFQYLGGPTAQNITDENEKNRLSMRARCLGARMLGKLACYIAMPAPGIDYSREPASPIEMFVEKVFIPSLIVRSVFQHTSAALIIVSWSEMNPEQICAIPPTLKEKLTQLVSEEGHYEETTSALSELQIEMNKFGGRLKKYFPDVDSETNILMQDLSEMCKQKKISAKVTEELVEKQMEISKMLHSIQSDEKQLDILTKGCLASALVSIEAIPQKLNPVIKPLMESIKRETNFEILTIVARNLAKLVDICVRNGNSVAYEKVIRNLMHFASSDPAITPQIRVDPTHVELGIIFLERGASKNLGKNDKSSNASIDGSSPEISIQSRGSSEALKAIVRYFGQSLVEKVPIFLEWTIGAVNKADTISVPDLLISLRTLEVCAPCFPECLLHHLEAGFSSLSKLLCHNSASIRHMSVRALVAIVSVQSLRVSVISMLIEKVLPFLGSEVAHHRQGCIECLAAIIESLGIDIVPFIVLIIIPILRRMSDQDISVRQMASATFASLIRLIPLDSPSSYTDNLPDHLAAKREVDRKFVDELMNIKNLEQYCLDFELNAELRSYQKEGINWLAFLGRYGLHGILCDDMGLGKTLQSICILAGDHMKRRLEFCNSGSVDSAPLPSLVICPATLCGHWKEEIEKFVDSKVLQPYVYSGTMQNRVELRSPLQKFVKSSDNIVVISSYEIVRNDSTFFKDFHWNYLILDEGHFIRNTKAKTTQAVKSLRANHRLILSGTPIQNSVLELWSLFDFLMPGFLGTERQFNSRYSRPIIASRGTGTSTSVSKEHQEAGALAMEALHRQVLPFVLRRMKDDVLKDLPPKITQDYYCELSPVQVMLYEDFAEKQKEAVMSGGDNGRIRTHVFQSLQYLRKVCNHPKLVLHPGHEQYTEVMQWLSDNNCTMESLHLAAKLPALKQLLFECGIGTEKDNENVLDGVVNQHRVLLFCQSKAMMEIMETDLLKKMPNVSYLRLDGSVPANSRMPLVNKFNSDPTIDVFLLSTSVGGHGLNLTGADTVIFVEHDWNPMKDLQAMDRAHRIGQKKVVNVYRLITRNTVEEKILGLQKFKLKTANTVISKDNASLESMGKEQIFELFSLESSNKSSKKKDQESGTGLKSVLENLPELWDEDQYEEEYNISGLKSNL